MTGPNEGTDNALDNAQTVTAIKRTTMSNEVCELFLAQTGKNYRKKETIKAINITQPIVLEDGKLGNVGDKLFKDNGIRILCREGFEDKYAPFRKPREKKEEK